MGKTSVRLLVCLSAGLLLSAGVRAADPATVEVRYSDYRLPGWFVG